MPEYVVIGGNGDTIYTRLMSAIGRLDLVGPNYKNNQDRVARQEEIEDAICSWTNQRPAEDVITAMNQAGVPVGRVVSVREVVENEHLQERGAVRDVPVKGWSVKMPGTFPVIDGVESQPQWAGPDLGQHTDEVLTEHLGLSSDELNALRQCGIII